MKGARRKLGHRRAAHDVRLVERFAEEPAMIVSPGQRGVFPSKANPRIAIHVLGCIEIRLRAEGDAGLKPGVGGVQRIADERIMLGASVEQRLISMRNTIFFMVFLTVLLNFLQN